MRASSPAESAASKKTGRSRQAVMLVVFYIALARVYACGLPGASHSDPRTARSILTASTSQTA